MAQDNIIKALIIDDHALFRKTMQLVLKNIRGILVMGEGDNGQAAVDKVGELNPDIIIMDVHMPGIDGIEATRRIKQTNDEIIIIALSNDSDNYYKQEMMKAGASDYLLKTASLKELEQSILHSLSMRNRSGPHP